MLKRIIILFILLMSFSISIYSADFYVNKGGSDSKNCSDRNSNACLTIQKGISVLSAGDTLNIGEGVYYEDASSSPYFSGNPGSTSVTGQAGYITASIAIDRSGTQSNPITIQGDPNNNNRPTIDCGHIYQGASSFRGGIFMYRKDYIHFKNFELRNCYSRGIYEWDHGNNNADVVEENAISKGIVIDGLKIHHIGGADNDAGISMWSTQDWTIRNTEIFDIYGWPEGGRTGCAIQSYGTVNALIENNHIFDVNCGIFWKDHYVADAITREPVFESEVRYNLIDVPGPGFFLGVQPDNEAGENYVHHNIIIGTEITEGAGITMKMVGVNYPTSALQRIENNIILGNNPVDSTAISLWGMSNVQLKGNIMSGYSSLIQSAQVVNLPTKIKASNYNIFAQFNNQLITLDRYSGGIPTIGYGTLSEWQNALASESVTLDFNNPDQNSITSTLSNLFVDPNNGDYTYKTDSPANNLLGPGRNAGPYEYGNEVIGINPNLNNNLGVWKGNQPENMNLGSVERTFVSVNEPNFWMGGVPVTIVNTNDPTSVSGNVGRIIYPANYPGSQSPTSNGIGNTFTGKDVYMSFYFRVSDNWQHHPIGVNKMFFITDESTGGGGDPIYLSYNENIVGGIDQPYIRPNLQGSLNGNSLVPADIVNKIPIPIGELALVEILIEGNTPGIQDGKYTMWINGELSASVENVGYFPSSSDGTFDTVKWEPTWGGAGGTVTNEMYQEITRLFVSYGDGSGTSPPVDNAPPSIPSNLQSPSKTESSISLTWNAASDTSGIKEYQIFRNGNQVGTTSSLSYTDSGLSSGTSYNYYIRAVDNNNNIGSNSLTETFFTSTINNNVLGEWRGNEPTNMNLGSAERNFSTLIEPDFTASGAPLQIVNTNDPTSVSGNVGRIIYPAGWDGGYSPGNVVLGNTYTGKDVYMSFYFKVSDNWQNHPTGTNKIFFITDEDTSGGGDPLVIQYNGDYIPLYGNPSIDAFLQGSLNGGSLVPTDFFNLVPLPFGEQALVEILAEGNTPGIENGKFTLWINGELSTTVNDVGYFYSGDGKFDTVKWEPTWGGGGGVVNEEMYQEISRLYISYGDGTGSTPPIDSTPPTQPTNLNSNTQTTSSISLNWDASTDNVGVSGYRIFRNGNSIGTTSSLSYTDNGPLSASTSYSYYIQAYDASGNIADSNPITATTLPTPPLTGTIVTVDSSYEYVDYDISHINDGNINTGWASEVGAVDHWILFTFNETKSVTDVTVDWAYNNYRGIYMGVQEMKVQRFDGSNYVDVATIIASTTTPSSTVNFPSVDTNRLRLLVPEGKANTNYEDIVWLNETTIGFGSNTYVPACGNGVVDSTETCDDGNKITESCSYNSPSCYVCSDSCQNILITGSYCGDGILDSLEGESCDGNNNGALCSTLGFQLGIVSCSSTCSLDYEMCSYDNNNGDTDPPEIGSGSPSGNLVYGTQNVILSVNTIFDSTCKYSSTNSSFDYLSSTDLLDNYGTVHNKTVSNLSSGSYMYYVKCVDDSGNINPSSYPINFIIDEEDISVPDKPSSSGGGGGSSSRKKSSILDNTPEACIPDYNAQAWSTCISGEQRRIVEDANNCVEVKSEIRSCSISNTEIENKFLNAKLIDIQKSENKKRTYNTRLTASYNEIFKTDTKLDDESFVLVDGDSGEEYLGKLVEENGGEFFYSLERIDETNLADLKFEGLVDSSVGEKVDGGFRSLFGSSIFITTVSVVSILLMLGFIIYLVIYIRKIHE